MTKIKIKEIKSKVKIIRELNDNSEGDKEIGQLTASEPMIEEASQITKTAKFVPREASTPRIVEQSVRPAQVPNREDTSQELTGNQLYNIGRGLGSESEGRRSYYAAQRATNVAQAFQENSTAPLGNRQPISSVRSIGRNEELFNDAPVEKRSYESGEKKRRAGPWE